MLRPTFFKRLSTRRWCVVNAFHSRCQGFEFETHCGWRFLPSFCIGATSCLNASKSTFQNLSNFIKILNNFMLKKSIKKASQPSAYLHSWRLGTSFAKQYSFSLQTSTNNYRNNRYCSWSTEHHFDMGLVRSNQFQATT